jgi:hypothetical protein
MKQTNSMAPAAIFINVCLYICILCIQVMSMCLPSICMSVQTVEVCVHVEMQLQLIYDLNTANTRFTINVFGAILYSVPKDPLPPKKNSV